MHKFLIAAALSTVAGAAGFAGSGSFSNLPPSLSGINVSAPRYTTEDERLVSEIAGSILNIAAFADHFETGDAFQVRNLGATPRSAKFSLARRAEVFTVDLPAHVWMPAGYVALARSFMADGAGLSISEDPAQDRAVLATVLDPAGLEAQNLRLSQLLAEHPRSAALHQRAALLLGAAAKDEPSPVNRRLVLCRMTAHLAIARALNQGGLDGEGQLAERHLAALAADERYDTRPATDAVLDDGPVQFAAGPTLRIVPSSPADPRR